MTHTRAFAVFVGGLLAAPLVARAGAPEVDAAGDERGGPGEGRDAAPEGGEEEADGVGEGALGEVDGAESGEGADKDGDAEAGEGLLSDSHARGSAGRGSIGGGASAAMRSEMTSAPQAKGDPKVNKLVPELDVRVIGSLSFNGNYRTWPNADGSGAEGSSFSFERIAFGLEGTYRSFIISADYRFYGKYGTLHHGYIGYKRSELFEIDVGVHRVPFGILPYASHNWFETLPYYVGLADDYDLGIKTITKKGGLDLQLAYYVQAERSQFGRTMDSARYSYDLVFTDASELGGSGVMSPQTNRERHSAVARVAYAWDHEGDDSSEIGLSGQFGGIYNATTRRYGNRWAAALHYNGWYRRFNLQAEALYYQFNPRNPSGQSRDWVTLGAWDAPYRVASRGFIGVANVGYRLPLAIKAFDWVMFYNDHSIMLKPTAGFDRTHMNVTGILLANRFVFLYLDTATGRNHPWFSPEYGTALAEGESDPNWWLWVNVSLGFYM